MKARVLLTRPEPVVGLEPDGEGDRRVLVRLLAGGKLQVSLQVGDRLVIRHVDVRPPAPRVREGPPHG